MDKVKQILSNSSYKEYMDLIHQHELDREFCKHSYDHLLSVARIAYILNLEGNHYFDKQLIYAAALLHDIGRWEQYQSGEDHAIVSSRLCVDILKDAGFDTQDIHLIQLAIREHRIKGHQTTAFSKIIYDADKLSRDCFVCPSIDKCKDSEQMKKRGLVW